MDVSNEASVKRAFNDAVLAFGGVDIVVNNAGLSLSKSLAETTGDAKICINCYGVDFTSRKI